MTRGDKNYISVRNESERDEVLKVIFEERGKVISIIPQKKSLEALFFKR